MGYDVSLVTDCGNGFVRIGSADWEYTYNLSEFFAWALRKGLAEFDGDDAWYLLDSIKHALYKIRVAERGSLDRFEPENGWGSVLGATIFLADIGIACAKAPNAKVRVR